MNDNSTVLPEILELVPGYLRNRHADLVKLQAALHEGDFTAIRFIGHNIKGNAENYGFPSLGLIGAELEEAAIRGDVPSLTAGIENFVKFLSKVSS